MNDYLRALKTESANAATAHIDECSTMEMVTMMNAEDAKVAVAVNAELANIARAVDIVYEAIKQDGRLIYLGAGTSGRLGVLDASECPPTFSTDPDVVQGFIAGGDRALREAVESSEDSTEEGVATIHNAKVTAKDVVMGITASGSAPYVLAALEEAKRIGAATVGLATNEDTPLAKVSDVCIEVKVGEEVIAGSTRLKSGTAQKLVLNMLSTCVMIKLGKVYGNLMVDLRPSNKKLTERAVRMVCNVAQCQESEGAKALSEADGNTKLAILMYKSHLPQAQAKTLLAKCDGVLRKALETLN